MKKNENRLDIRLPCYIKQDFLKLCKEKNIAYSCYIRNLISLEIIKHGKNK